MPVKLTKLIHTEAEYQAAMTEIDRLMARNPEAGTAASDRLEVLALHIDEYERRTYKMSPPNPVEAIRFRMEQAGLRQKDLIPILGTRSRVSEVLSGKRPLSKRMICGLHEKLGIPLESLLAPTSSG